MCVCMHAHTYVLHVCEHTDMGVRVPVGGDVLRMSLAFVDLSL